MTHHDPATGETREHVATPAPAPASSDQVNVNAAGQRTYVAAATSPLTIARRIVGLLFGILIGLMAIRIILLALGANEGNVIVDAVYGFTEPFVAPFRGVFSIDTVRPVGRSVFDIGALVAIVGWSLIALVILAILRIPDRAP
jgi:hypothetical protein